MYMYLLLNVCVCLLKSARNSKFHNGNINQVNKLRKQCEFLSCLHFVPCFSRYYIFVSVPFPHFSVCIRKLRETVTTQAIPILYRCIRLRLSLTTHLNLYFYTVLFFLVPCYSLFLLFAVSTAIQNTGIAFTSSRFKHTSWSNRRVREPLSMPLTTSRELQLSLQLRHRLLLSFNFKILRRRRRAEQEKSKKGQEIKYAHALLFPDFI